MNQDYPTFQNRVSRISRARRNRVQGEFVLHSNGILVPKTRGLRFGFPLKGLIVAFVICVAVKAYLIWFLGLELYESEMLELLSGTSFEQAAARILMPDGLSLWVADFYGWIAEQFAAIQAGAAETAEG